MSTIKIEDVSKSFRGTVVLQHFSITIQAGSITVFLAPSGAGKTTLLRLIAGLDAPDAGTITFEDGIVAPSGDIGFIFQQESVFPWLSVRDNVAFGLSLRTNRDRANRVTALVDEMCDSVGLDVDLRGRFPRQLSGGQRQRVVIARSLALRPRLLLCDEPFSSLDDRTRQSLRNEVLKIRDQYQPTIIFITHNVEEALYLADVVVVCEGPPLAIQSVQQITFESRDEELITSDVFRKKLRELQTYTR